MSSRVLFPSSSSAADVVRSPRPVSWRIVPGDPPLMQPYVGNAVSSALKQIASADVVFLGVKRGDAGDYALAEELISRLSTAAGKGRRVAVGLDDAPLGSDLSSARTWFGEAGGAGAWPAVLSGGGDATYLAPINGLQASGKVSGVVPLGVAAEAMGKVQRNGGIRALSEEERFDYVDDVGAFVRYEKQPGFDVYAKRVVERKYADRYGNATDARPGADRAEQSRAEGQHKKRERRSRAERETRRGDFRRRRIPTSSRRPSSTTRP